jgi:hypothetical protein
MMHKTIRHLMLALAFLVMAGCADLRPGSIASIGWRQLGTLQVGPGKDHDQLSVGTDAGRFRELRIEVRGGPVELNDMVVTFTDGSSFRPNFRSRYDERARSEEIDLPGDRRSINQVDFTYSADRSGVTLTVYGR